MRHLALAKTVLAKTVLASVALLALAAACTDKGAGPTDPAQAAAPADPQAPAPAATVNSTIDWNAARADLSKRPAGMENMSVQAVGKDGPPKVPMLLPSLVTPQGVGGDRPTPPVVTADGYFATYHLPKYDAIVNGSMSATPAPGQAAGDKTKMKFTTGEASAQIAFSKYGADYLIEFECREADGATSCITEPEAKEFAEGLFVAQTQ